ncbi:MAG TPA: hypothetical protein VM183_13240 [Burkholderiales bacterium]|nr:hypothetical protein [Burkholderiales bacterium]
MRLIAGLAFALWFALAACGGDAVSCTAMGCGDGLGVSLQNPPAEAYRVDVIVPGQATQSQSCNGGSCFIFFDRFLPGQVTVRVILTASSATWGSVDATPTYNPVFPNGFECGAACVRGFVTVRAGP